MIGILDDCVEPRNIILCLVMELNPLIEILLELVWPLLLLGEVDLHLLDIICQILILFVFILEVDFMPRNELLPLMELCLEISDEVISVLEVLLPRSDGPLFVNDALLIRLKFHR